VPMRSFIGRREHVLGLGGCATMANRVGSRTSPLSEPTRSSRDGPTGVHHRGGRGHPRQPPAAKAQQPGAVPRAGDIHHGGDWQLWAEGLQQGLRELGLDEGRHLVLETRETRGDLKAVEVAARDLERGKVTLICTAATSVTLAAKRATTQTPIV